MLENTVKWEKTFANFALFFFFKPIGEDFSANCLKAQWTVGGTSKKSTKFFSVKFNFPTNLRKCSPTKDSRYTVV